MEDSNEGGQPRGDKTFICDNDSVEQNKKEKDSLEIDEEMAKMLPTENRELLVSVQPQKYSNVSPTIKGTPTIRDEFIEDNDNNDDFGDVDENNKDETSPIPPEIGSPTASIKRTLDISFF